MRKILVGIGIVIAVLILALVITSKGEAHQSGYCGHAAKYWVVYPPSGHPLRYGMFNTGGWGAGPHYHEYKTFVEKWNTVTGQSYWSPIDTHVRQCNTWV